MKKKNCVIMRCTQPRLARGLCVLHYWRAKNKIDRGETTWEKEASQGRAKAPKFPRKGPFSSQLTPVPTHKMKAAVDKIVADVHSGHNHNIKGAGKVEDSDRLIHAGPAKLCMVPGCSDAAATRGLCKKDYAVANLLVRKGKTTWKKLVSSGKVEQSFKEVPRVQMAKDFFLGK